jgi:hypothetical protein
MMSSATIGLGVWAKTDRLAPGRYRANPLTAVVRVFVDFLALAAVTSGLQDVNNWLSAMLVRWRQPRRGQWRLEHV